MSTIACNAIITTTPPVRNERDGAAARRFAFTYDELNVGNVTRAKIITLLRERARNLRATYVRLQRCINNSLVGPFTFDREEGDGSWDRRAQNLNEHIHKHVKEIEVLRERTNRDLDEKKRWKRANCGGGRVVREMGELFRAVHSELLRRDDNGTFAGCPLEHREKIDGIPAASRKNSAAVRVTRVMKREQNIAAQNLLVERSIEMEKIV